MNVLWLCLWLMLRAECFVCGRVFACGCMCVCMCVESGSGYQWRFSISRTHIRSTSAHNLSGLANPGSYILTHAVTQTHTHTEAHTHCVVQQLWHSSRCLNSWPAAHQAQTHTHTNKSHIHVDSGGTSDHLVWISSLSPSSVSPSSPSSPSALSLSVSQLSSEGIMKNMEMCSFKFSVTNSLPFLPSLESHWCLLRHLFVSPSPSTVLLFLTSLQFMDSVSQTLSVSFSFSPQSPSVHQFGWWCLWCCWLSQPLPSSSLNLSVHWASTATWPKAKVDMHIHMSYGISHQ